MRRSRSGWLGGWQAMCRDPRTPVSLSMANATIRGVPGRMVGAGARWSCALRVTRTVRTERRARRSIVTKLVVEGLLLWVGRKLCRERPVCDSCFAKLPHACPRCKNDECHGLEIFSVEISAITALDEEKLGCDRFEGSQPKNVRIRRERFVFEGSVAHPADPTGAPWRHGPTTGGL